MTISLHLRITPRTGKTVLRLRNDILFKTKTSQLIVRISWVFSGLYAYGRSLRLTNEARQKIRPLVQTTQSSNEHEASERTSSYSSYVIRPTTHRPASYLILAVFSAENINGDLKQGSKLQLWASCALSSKRIISNLLKNKHRHARCVRVIFSEQKNP